MKVLYLMSVRDHSHDFGADFLYHGLCSNLGNENVFAWPQNKSLHAFEDRGLCDICEKNPYDSDDMWPVKNYSFEQAVEICDLAIIACQPGDYTISGTSEMFSKLWNRKKPIAAYDTGDSVDATHAFFRAVANGPLVAFFKRELPIGESWALPMPLSYPAKRAMKGQVFKDISLSYHASDHGKEGPGLPRVQIIAQLNKFFFGCQGFSYELHNTENKLNPYRFHEILSQSILGISWNGAPYTKTWDNNRFWEHFAFGVCQIAHRPTIQIPHPPIDGEHLFYVDSVDEIGNKAVQLLTGDPELPLRVAGNGYNHFMKYHSSERRAEYMLEIIKRLG